jgi:hypothetical protein
MICWEILAGGEASAMFPRWKDVLLIWCFHAPCQMCTFFFLLFRNSFFWGGWSALRLQWHDLPYPAPGAMETGLVDWTIGLITPSYGKLEICSSCLSWPMSVSVLLASIHSALHVDNNLSSCSLSSTSVCDYLNLYRCITALSCVMQMHQAFFSILYSPLPYSRFISVLV